MTVVDMDSGAQVHTTTAGRAKHSPQMRGLTVTFTPWNGWMDGHKYNISYHATLPDGSKSGNTRDTSTLDLHTMLMSQSYQEIPLELMQSSKIWLFLE